MGFLDQKERILDIILTDKGKEDLSKGLLNFTYFAFSDEGVNYSGSFVAGTLDDYLFRTILIEADQRAYDTEGRKSGKQLENLKSYLYTIPSGQQVLSEMKTSVDDVDSLVLTRRYYIQDFSLTTKKRQTVNNPIATIIRAQSPIQTFDTRSKTYVNDQKFKQTLEEHLTGKPINGKFLTEDVMVVNTNTALNVKTGKASSLLDIVNNIEDISVTNVENSVEVVSGLETAKIELRIKNKEKETPARLGFLIEVFESGSDGKLKKLAVDDIVDPRTDETLKEGFSSFLRLTVDDES